MKTILSFAAVAGIIACSSPPIQYPTPSEQQPVQQESPGVICTMEARSAVEVRVHDAAGAMLPTGTNVRVVARTHNFADTALFVTRADMNSVGLAPERDGTYVVEVWAPGYRTWTIHDVKVPKTTDGCHVQTATVKARLSR